jgi:hypothetical protein
MATSEDELQTMAYHPNLIARTNQNEHIKHQNKINGNVWESHTKSKNRHK